MHKNKIKRRRITALALASVLAIGLWNPYGTLAADAEPDNAASNTVVNELQDESSDIVSGEPKDVVADSAADEPKDTGADTTPEVPASPEKIQKAAPAGSSDAADTQNPVQVEESQPANVLTCDNADAIATEREQGTDEIEPYVGIELIGGNDFPEGSYAKVEILKEEEQEAYVQELKNWLNEEQDSKASDAQKVTARFSVLIEVYGKDGVELEDLGKVTVKLTTEKAEDLKDMELYHGKADDTWEKVDYKVYVADDTTEYDTSYVEFSTDSFSPFLFGKIEKDGTDADGTVKDTDEDMDADDGDTGVDGQSDVEPVSIDEFQVSFSSGATKTDGQWVWNPTDPASGHQFVYRADYTMSGTFSMEKGAFRIELPLHILKDREGNWADEFECPYVMESEVSEGEEPDFVYSIDEENNKVCIYNYKPYPTGEAGYIEFAYVTEKSTLYYKDMVESTAVLAKVYATNEASTVTKEAEADPVVINTHATINYTQKKVPDYYSMWQDSWGTASEDAEDYVYLVWTVRTNINKITSPYNFTIADTFNDLEGDVVGYRMAGQSSYSELNHVENQTGYGDRYDYVLTRHNKEEAERLIAESGRYEVTNQVTATVDPIDQVDEDTVASASRSWWYETPTYTAPTGHFWADKWGIYGKYNRVRDSEDISDYTLEEFQEGEEESIDNLRYYTYCEGYAWPWTLSDDADGTIEDALQGRYGQKKVSYEFTDDTFYLEGSDTPLKDEDYNVTGIEWTPTMRTAVFNDTSLSFTESAVTDYQEEDAVTIYVRVGEEWKQAAIYDMKTADYKDIDSTYIMSASGANVQFAKNVKGFRFACENAYYHTKIEVYPIVSLKRTENVLDKIGKETGKMKVKLTNQSSFNVTQNDGLLYSRTMQGTDYIQRVARESEIKKDVIQTRNDKSKRQFVVTWRVTAQEKYTDNSGLHSIYQESGTFYDLVPSGAVIDKSSVAVMASGEQLTEGTYEVSTIENYKNSGRTLLVIRIKESTGTVYQFSYNTAHSYESIYDYGKNLLNSVAYETGNDNIAEGYPDNGGKITDKNILAGLDETTDAEKFLYAEARYDINILMAANTGLMKQVKNEDDTAYSYNTTVYNGGTYSYRVRLANDSVTKAKNIVLFDSLENFYQEVNETSPTIPSDWKGTLTGIDTSSMTSKDVDAVVYLSRVENMNIHGHHDLDEVLDGERVWVEYSEFEALYGLEAARAVAVDARKMTDQADFVLGAKESISFTVYMKAPKEDITGKTDPVTYNNIYVERTVLKSSGDEIYEIEQFFHQDYTQVHYRIVGSLDLKKVDKTDMTSPVSGAVYLLRGTSDYGTEYELTRVSDRSGSLSFDNLEKGTYELLETSCGDAWQLNTEVYTVIINEKGETEMSLTKEGEVYLVADEPRIYADISFKKSDSITGQLLSDVEFMLSGTSDYGNDVLLYASSGDSGGSEGKVTFSGVELGTYQLIEVHNPGDYIVSDTVWTVKVSGQGLFAIYNGEEELDLSTDGSYRIENEPYHEIRFLKSSTYGENIYLEGAEFSLTGVSDYGTDVNMTSTSAPEEDGGLVVFAGLEPGTYLLKETKAPEGHELNELTYTVVVESDGNFEIEGLEKTKFGSAEVYDFKDTKSSGTICLIKKWVDNKTNDEREIPDMTITTQKPSKNPLGYTIAFDANGGAYAGTTDTVNEVVYNKSNAIVAGTYKAPAIESEYVTFAGWYTSASGGTKVTFSNNGIPTNTLNGDITLYAHWNSPPRYAVAIYGIGVDTDINGKTMGLTFGPALGENYLNSYKSHAPTGTTDSGNTHRCVHNDDWRTIISWNKTDPYVYEQCIAEGCTHSVVLSKNTTSTILSTSSSVTSVSYTGDGPSVLYNELYYRTYENLKWHPIGAAVSGSGNVEGGWGASRVRAMLNQKDSLTDTSSAGYGNLYTASVYTAPNCLLQTFPTELRNAIGKKKISANRSEDTNDKLWLLDSTELGVTSKDDAYQKFMGTAVSGRIGYDSSGRKQEFWLRDVDKVMNRANYINASGTRSTMSAGYSSGIAPGFSLSR